MADRQETTTDIIAEMNRVEVCSGGEPCLRDYADRLDAAHKRELDALNEQMADLRQQRDLWSKRSAELVAKCNEQYAKLKQVGNAAKLRKALKAAELGLFRWLSGSISRDEHRELVAMIKTALAEPLRHCDALSESACAVYFDALYTGNRDGVCVATTEREKNIHRYYCKYIDWLFATNKAKGDTK